MKIGKTSDTSALTSVRRISDEIEPAFVVVSSQHADTDLEIFYAFRCLPDSIGRKTFRRYSRSENVLYLDMTFSENELAVMSEEEQRDCVSRFFYDYTYESLLKYKFAGLDVERFMADLDSACEEAGWPSSFPQG